LSDLNTPLKTLSLPGDREGDDQETIHGVVIATNNGRCIEEDIGDFRSWRAERKEDNAGLKAGRR